MRKLYIILFSLLMAIGLKAQEIKILSFKQNPMDVSASTHPKFDANNDAGALVKVLFAEPNVKFEGNIIGLPEFKTNEYWVYLTTGTKFFVIKVPNAIPIKVSFVDHNLPFAQSKTTYELVLSRNGQTQKQKFTITFSPANAAVLIDNNLYPTKDGKAIGMLPVGKHDFTIAALGYESSEGAFTLKSSAPYNAEIHLSKSEVETEETYVSQNNNNRYENVNNNSTIESQSLGVTYTANSQHILDKLEEGKRLYNNKDYTAAYKCFQIAASAGNAEGQLWIGLCYEKGNGVDMDYKKAVIWYKKSAEQNNALAQLNLGYCYGRGYGVEQDYGEATRWYRKAADQGNFYAQYNLGDSYKNGHGVTKDYSEAVKWYRKAAAQNYVLAQINLGYCYDNGYGVIQNHEEAVKWFRKAAEQGHAIAQYNLGICYQNGSGVTKDIKEALKWFEKAAEQGYERAKVNIDTIKQQENTNNKITLKLKVVDKDDVDVLIGTIIRHYRIEGTSSTYITNIVSDIDGLASLKDFQAGDGIEVSYIGYRTQDIRFSKLPTSGEYTVVMPKGSRKKTDKIIY